VSKINSCVPLRAVAIVQGPVTVPVNAGIHSLGNCLHASMYRGIDTLSGWGGLNRALTL
jgi:hypothetical protein